MCKTIRDGGGSGGWLNYRLLREKLEVENGFFLPVRIQGGIDGTYGGDALVDQNNNILVVYKVISRRRNSQRQQGLHIFIPNDLWWLNNPSLAVPPDLFDIDNRWEVYKALIVTKIQREGQRSRTEFEQENENTGSILGDPAADVESVGSILSYIEIAPLVLREIPLVAAPVPEHPLQVRRSVRQAAIRENQNVNAEIDELESKSGFGIMERNRWGEVISQGMLNGTAISRLQKTRIERILYCKSLFIGQETIEEAIFLNAMGSYKRRVRVLLQRLRRAWFFPAVMQNHQGFISNNKNNA
jgi:hypothetical protein